MSSEVFNDEFKIRSDVCVVIFIEIYFDVFFQINMADQYRIFKSSRASISAPTPSIPTEISCGLSQSVLANVGVEG